MAKSSGVKIRGADRIYSQAHFLEALASFLVDKQTEKSLALQIEGNARPLIAWALHWQQIYGLSNIQGWADRQEAISGLCKLLGIQANRIFEILNAHHNKSVYVFTKTNGSKR